MKERYFKLMREIRAGELAPRPVLNPTDKTKKIAASRIKHQALWHEKQATKNGWEL